MFFCQDVEKRILPVTFFRNYAYVVRSSVLALCQMVLICKLRTFWYIKLQNSRKNKHFRAILCWLLRKFSLAARYIL